MGEGKANASQAPTDTQPTTGHTAGTGSGHPAEQTHSPQGGPKDTDDLSGVKGVPTPDMVEKARQVEQTPKDVTGEHDGIQPQNQRR